MDLPFDDQRVDQIAGIVDGDQLQQLRLAGLAIDFEHRDVAAERIGVVRRLEERFVAQARLEARRAAAPAHTRTRRPRRTASPTPASPYGDRAVLEHDDRLRSLRACAAANFAIFVLTLAPARCSAVPPTACERLPKVPMPCFTTPVSPCRIVTCSIGTPNWSASICANVVSLPWPCGDAPVVARDAAVALDGDLRVLPAAGRQRR